MPIIFGDSWKELNKKQAPNQGTAKFKNIPKVDIQGSESENINKINQLYENLPKDKPKSNGGFPLNLLSPDMKKLLGIEEI